VQGTAEQRFIKRFIKNRKNIKKGLTIKTEADIINNRRRDAMVFSSTEYSTVRAVRVVV
jgi:hypothetical protein